MRNQRLSFLTAGGHVALFLQAVGTCRITIT